MISTLMTDSESTVTNKDDELCNPFTLKGSRVFLLHKPVGVICATVDSKVTNIITRKSNPRCGARQGGVPRPTVYDIVTKLGFPNDVGLVGRLDCETSGVILFSDDQKLAKAVRDPVTESSSLYTSAYKMKIYEVRLLCSTKHLSKDEFNITKIETDLATPYSFSRQNTEYHTNDHTKVQVLNIYQDQEKSRGRVDLGWVIHIQVTLNEGKHHQIRRMASRNGYSVIALIRVSIAHILHIDSVPEPGDCRWLSQQEIDTLYTHLHINEQGKGTSIDFDTKTCYSDSDSDDVKKQDTVNEFNTLPIHHHIDEDNVYD